VNHLLICGAAGYTNLGDDAILWGMLTQLRDALPERPVRVAGGPELEKLAGAFGATAISYEDRAELARAIEEADVVVLGGGGLLYDVGYDASLARLVGDPTDRQWLYEMARVAAAAGAAGRPVMLYGLGVGPLLTESARQVVRFIGEQSKAITLRDQASADLVVACGVPRTRAHVAADPAVAVEAGSTEAGESLLREWGLGEAPRPWVAVNLRPWADEGERKRLAAGGAALVRAVRERLGGTAVLLPLQRLHDDDRPVLEEVARAAGREAGAVLVEPAALPPDLVGALGHFDLVVGMRVHALVLALDAGTPFVALSYDAKVDEFARAAGLGAHVYPAAEFEASAVIESCEALLSEREGVAARLEARRSELRERAALSAELAKELLEARRLESHFLPIAMQPTPVDEIRVLMQIRPDYLEKPGGDTVQMEETRRQLEALGANVKLSAEESPDLGEYDLVHVFNLGRPLEPWRQCLDAVAQGRPVALSTVYWDFGEFWEWGDPDYWELPPPEEGLPRPMPAPPPDPIEARRRARLDQQRQAAIDCATVYLPNGEGEAEILRDAYGMDSSRTVVVPNGVSELFFEARPEAFQDKYRLRDFVLCAARVEKRKNQLALVAALRGSGIPLVIVGQANPEEYRELCRRYADDNVTFIEALPQEELASAYAAAKVHALPGWFETPGLSTLEAAAAGCNVVSTERGLAREYLGEMAWYCDPRSLESIRAAVVAAYEAPRSERLREHVRERYTWRHAAERTLEGYRLALALHGGRGDLQQTQAAMEATRRHAEFLARLAADRGYEAQRMREWGETVEGELVRLQEEFRRVTSRRLHRWSAAAARAGWGMLRRLGVRR